jgi:hypothetical protein
VSTSPGWGATSPATDWQVSLAPDICCAVPLVVDVGVPGRGVRSISIASTSTGVFLVDIGIVDGHPVVRP